MPETDIREIKFRGKRLDNGEWVYGFLSLHDYIADRGTHHRVNPKTVGQFTGMTNKDGIEVYRGDLLDCGNGLLIVDWDVHVHCWSLYEADTSEFSDQMAGYECAKVVGNIHDNMKWCIQENWEIQESE